MRVLTVWTTLGLCTSVPIAALAAQSNTRTIRSVALDPLGSVIAGATVDIRCGAERRRATTSSTGEFAEHELPPVSCSVTVRSESFEPATLTLDSRSIAPARLVLQVRRLAHEVVVTPTRGIEESAFNVPEAMSVTSRQDIDSRPYTLWSQVLREEPGILLQQTTSGQVSPVIRGFTGQSNVYLLDGVRLNMAAWRSGPSQYLAWVDSAPVNAVEIVRGSGSVQYGSDALGGTVQLRSEPALFGVAPAPVTASVELSGGTADQSVGAEATLWFRAKQAIVRGGGNRRDVGDLRAGGGIDSHSAVRRFLGLPSTILGTRHVGTAFRQGGVHGGADIAIGGGLVHALYLHEEQIGANRYDRLLGGAGLFKSGFDPQAFDFAVFRVAKSEVAGIGAVSATVSFNRQADGRFEQARPTARLDRQEATATALGYQVQTHRELAGRHLLVAGGEFYDESISASRQLVEPTGAAQRARPDIPDGTSYTNFGVFAQQSAAFSRFTLRGGLRYSRFSFSSREDRVLGVLDETVTTRSLTFQAASIVSLSETLNVTASYGRGFRGPNAADLGGIGLTGGGGFEITPSRAAAMGAFVGSTAGSTAVSTGLRVPNGLRPEVAHQFEVGVKARRDRFSANANVFDMELYDFIQRRALIFDRRVVGTATTGFDIVRQDPSGAAYIAQDPRPVVTRVNVGRARILGFDAEGEIRLNRSWTANAYFSVANGRTLPAGGYIRRMPPPLGGARLRWNGERLWIEGAASFAAKHTRLSAGDLGDARTGALRSRATIADFFNGAAVDLGLVQHGVLQATGETLPDVQNRLLGAASSAPLFTTHPGFVVVGLRAGIRVTPALDITLIGENLGDVNYRWYGSGVDALGAGLQVRLRYRF
jgi:outer membrane receptor protein involved in Fe transport